MDIHSMAYSGSAFTPFGLFLEQGAELHGIQFTQLVNRHAQRRKAAAVRLLASPAFRTTLARPAQILISS